MAEARVERRLAAILAADVTGYSRLMGADEVGTLAALKALRREIVDPAIAEHHGRIVKTTGDGMLVEFASAVDAVNCAVGVQTKMAERDSGDLRSKSRSASVSTSGISSSKATISSETASMSQPESRTNASRVVFTYPPVHSSMSEARSTLRSTIWGKERLKISTARCGSTARGPGRRYHQSSPNSSTEFNKLLPLPDKPSIAVLPFQNMSGDPEQEYFADGMVEEIITALSRFKSLFVIARNSTFTYKGRAVDIKQVGRELGVRLCAGRERASGGRARPNLGSIGRGRKGRPSLGQHI